MGPLTYMWFIVDWNVVKQCMTVYIHTYFIYIWAGKWFINLILHLVCANLCLGYWKFKDDLKLKEPLEWWGREWVIREYRVKERCVWSKTEQHRLLGRAHLDVISEYYLSRYIVEQII